MRFTLLPIVALAMSIVAASARAHESGSCEREANEYVDSLKRTAPALRELIAASARAASTSLEIDNTQNDVAALVLLRSHFQVYMPELLESVDSYVDRTNTALDAATRYLRCTRNLE